MTVHTCTRCPLRFLTRAELADHMAHDHHVPARVLQSISYPGAEEAMPLYRSFSERDGVYRILLVSNQTVESPQVMDLLRQREVAHERMSVFVCVPATPSTHLMIPTRLTGRGNAEQMDMRADDAGLAQARWRLRRALKSITSAGIVAHGAVGDPNPVAAIADAIAQQPVDEIVLCTLSRAMSRWLEIDVPTAIRRRFATPLTVLTTEEEGVAAEGSAPVDITDRIAEAHDSAAGEATGMPRSR